MKMIKTFFLCLSVMSLMTSCKPDLPDTSKFNPNSFGGRESNPNAPMFWKSSRLPLKVYISEDFENDEFVGEYDSETEQNPFEQMQQNWESAVSGKTLFTLDLPTVPNYSPSGMAGFDDAEIGIYKSTGWYSEISSSALAVTQYFAYRRNVGEPNEYLDMVHADIILNYRHHDFTMNADNPPINHFDLPTVVNHELGHLLGLGHIDSTSAVMNSFLSPQQNKRTLFAADRNAIRDLYENYSTLSSGSLPLGVSAMSDGQEHPDEGQLVKGMIEQRMDGKCRHFENGKLVLEH